MSRTTLTRLAACAAAGAAIAASTLAVSPRASAQLDPRIPIPILSWCLGGGSGSNFGSYCEGTNFPDGTRLNYFRALGFWQGPRCIRPDGSPTPPLAPGGCGGIG